MDQENILKESRERMEKTVESFQEEIRKIQTGRATPLLVEGITVEYYGSKAPIKQVAAIAVPEPRLITITPWNKDDLVSIQKAIDESDLGVKAQNDGEVVRVVFPSLTQERREELKKVIGGEKEKARIAVKQAREDAWSELKDMESEDDKFRAKDKLQETVEEFNKKIEEIASKKEEEIMTV